MTQRVLHAASIAVLTGFVGCGEPDVIVIAPAPGPVGEVVAPAEPSGTDGTPTADEPRGLVSKRSGVTPGYVLFSPLASDRTYPIDSGGRYEISDGAPWGPSELAW
jgi:hypothetical protein